MAQRTTDALCGPSRGAGAASGYAASINTLIITGKWSGTPKLVGSAWPRKNKSTPLATLLASPFAATGCLLICVWKRVSVPIVETRNWSPKEASSDTEHGALKLKTIGAFTGLPPAAPGGWGSYFRGHRQRGTGCGSHPHGARGQVNEMLQCLCFGLSTGILMKQIFFRPSDLSWSALAVGGGQPATQQPEFAKWCFSILDVSERTVRQREGEREGKRRTTESDTQKRGEKVWELTKTNSVLDQHKCCSFSRPGWLESITRCSMKRRSDVGDSEPEWGTKAWAYLFF